MCCCTELSDFSELVTDIENKEICILELNLPEKQRQNGNQIIYPYLNVAYCGTRPLSEGYVDLIVLFKYCPFCGRRYEKSEEKLNLKSLQNMDEGYQLYLMLKDIYERND